MGYTPPGTKPMLANPLAGMSLAEKDAIIAKMAEQILIQDKAIDETRHAINALADEHNKLCERVDALEQGKPKPRQTLDDDLMSKIRTVIESLPPDYRFNAKSISDTLKVQGVKCTPQMVGHRIRHMERKGELTYHKESGSRGSYQRSLG